MSWSGGPWNDANVSLAPLSSSLSILHVYMCVYLHTHINIFRKQRGAIEATTCIDHCCHRYEPLMIISLSVPLPYGQIHSCEAEPLGAPTSVGLWNFLVTFATCFGSTRRNPKGSLELHLYSPYPTV